MKLAAGIGGAGLVGAAALIYMAFGAFLPWREAAEAERLAELAGVRDGQVVADIGAGGGRFAEALARRVGETGRVYASELPGPTRDALADRVRGLANVVVVTGERERTHLPAACCDLVLMRNMFHHVSDPAAFLGEIGRAVKPGGRVVAIDFEPGGLWFHGGRPDDAAPSRSGHGVSMKVAIGEFAAAGFRVEHADARWSRPLWLVMFRRAS
jgi:ubiquinone/menaquinone biosynthesis C-methylase UbiE